MADGDAPSYLPGPTLEVQQGFYVGLEKVSFTGAGTMRPWPATLLFGVIPEMNLRSFAQLVISICAFVVLAWAVHGVLTTTKARLLGVLGVLVIGLLPSVTVWDSHLWRESLSMSSLVLLLAFAVMCCRRLSTWAAVGVALAGLLMILMRFTYFPIAASVFVFVLILSRSGASKRSLVWTATFAAASFGVLGYGYSYFKAQDSGWIPWYGQSISESQFGYIHSASNPAINVLMDELAPEYPECVASTLPVEAEYPSKHWYHVLDNRDTCPELGDYIRSGQWSDEYVKFLVTTPEYSARVLWRVLPASMGWIQPVDHISLLPQAASSLVAPTTTPTGTFEPLPLWFVGVVTLLVLVRRRSKTDGDVSTQIDRSHIRLIAASTVVVLSTAASIIIGTLLTPTVDADPFRISIAASTGLRLAAVLLAAVAVDLLLVGPREKAPSD